MEAALALGCITAMVPTKANDVNHDQPALALGKLTSFYRDACYDSRSGRHKPLDFTDLAEYHVRLAVLAALARSRTPEGFSQDSVIDLLLDALLHAENRSSQFDSVGAPRGSPWPKTPVSVRSCPPMPGCWTQTFLSSSHATNQRHVARHNACTVIPHARAWPPSRSHRVQDSESASSRAWASLHQPPPTSCSRCCMLCSTH